MPTSVCAGIPLILFRLVLVIGSTSGLSMMVLECYQSVRYTRFREDVGSVSTTNPYTTVVQHLV